LGHLGDLEADDPDSSSWKAILCSIPIEQRNWLDTPWIIAEFYFYRRLMNIFPYMEGSYDLFRQQKENGLLSSFDHFEEIAMTWIQNDFSSTPLENSLQFGILTSLWGNKKDLSLWPASSARGTGISSPLVASAPQLSTVVENILSSTSPQILDNHLESIVRHLISQGEPHTGSTHPPSPRSVGIILDNAGYELLCDLFLGTCLISLRLADQICFFTKKHPTFVSDATTADCVHTIRTLSQLAQDRYPHCQALGAEWMEFIDKKIFIFSDDFFWCQPTGFRSLPPRISTQLSPHLVTFIKVFTHLTALFLSIRSLLAQGRRQLSEDLGRSTLAS
jgi:hypothetical protein